MGEDFLKEALKEAESAFLKGEVPVGCVVVKDGEVIARAHNLTESLKDASAHAEMIALREASEKLGDWRLNGCEVYVTLEPCVMCSYALVLFRVERVVFGALDEKHGGVVSLYSILDDHRLNHKVSWVYKPHEDCVRLLKEFFRRKRW
jgi:tRNA(adenine34) deaminase